MPFKHHIFILLIYSLLIIAMSWPVFWTFTQAVAGSGGDAWQTMWRFSVSRSEIVDAIKNGQLVNFAKQEIFGFGSPQLVNLSVWPWLWLDFLFGQPAAYNTVWFLSYLLSGYSMFLLTSYLTKNSQPKTILASYGAPFLAGLAYMFLPYHIAHSYGHFGAMQTQWLPFIILCSLVLLRRPTLLKSLLLAFLLVIQAWSEHHYLLWLLIFLVPFSLFYRRQIIRFYHQPISYLTTAIVLLAVVLLIILPFRPTFQLVLPAVSDLKLGLDQTVNFSAEPLSYLTPASFHPLWGKLFYKFISRNFTGNVSEATFFLGLAPFLLVVFFQSPIPAKQRYFWFSISALFFLITLGPYLHLLGKITFLPLPYLWLSHWPIFDSIRTVGRAAIMVNIAWLILFCWVLIKNLHRPISLYFLIIVLLFEFLFYPFPVQPVNRPPVYDTLQSIPGQTVIELPAATDYNIASQSLYWTLFHHKDVIGNIALARAQSGALFKEVRTWPAIRQLLYLQSDYLSSDQPEFFQQDMAETFYDIARWQKITAIIVHQNSLSSSELNAVTHFAEKTLSLSPQIISDSILYRLPDQSISDGVFLGRDSNWQNVFYDHTHNAYHAEINDQANLFIYNTVGRQQTVRLRWNTPTTEQPNLSFSTDAEYHADWHETQHTMMLDITTRPGITTVTIKNQSSAPAVFDQPAMKVLIIDDKS